MRGTATMRRKNLVPDGGSRYRVSLNVAALHAYFLQPQKRHQQSRFGFCLCANTSFASRSGQDCHCEAYGLVAEF